MTTARALPQFRWQQLGRCLARGIVGTGCHSGQFVACRSCQQTAHGVGVVVMLLLLLVAPLVVCLDYLGL